MLAPKRETDDPQYLKGYGEPMPFASHNEYWQAKKMVERLYDIDKISESDHAELMHLQKRIFNHEKLDI